MWALDLGLLVTTQKTTSLLWIGLAGLVLAGSPLPVVLAVLLVSTVFGLGVAALTVADAGAALAGPVFLGVCLFIDWRRRLVRSVSLWARPAGLYAMGEVSAHITATRIPPRRGITTSCGVYAYRGDWRTVMFGEGYATPPPLQTTTTE